MKIVGIGGGTGLPVLLSGLKTLRDTGESDVQIAALVTVSDSGGSTGELRSALGIPAVGDLRNCFVALGDSQPVLKALCQHRIDGVHGFHGHSVGNVLLGALYQMAGDFDGMIRLGGLLFHLKDRVLPCTNLPVTLFAEFSDGSVVRGEANIPSQRRPIRRVWLEPQHPAPAAGVLEAIAEADVITFGPGSLYTSVIANLLVADIADAIHASRALKVYVCNLMTQAGETEGYSAADHLRVLQAYLPTNTIDVCLVNTRPIKSLLRQRYAQSASHPVDATAEQIMSLGVICEANAFLEESRDKVRHDGLALARRITAIARGRKEWEVLCAEL